MLPVLGGFLSDPITPHPVVRPGVAGALTPLGRRQAWTRAAGPRTHTDQPQAIFSTRFLSTPEPPSSYSVTQKKRCARFGLAFFLIIQTLFLAREGSIKIASSFPVGPAWLQASLRRGQGAEPELGGSPQVLCEPDPFRRHPGPWEWSRVDSLASQSSQDWPCFLQGVERAPVHRARPATVMGADELLFPVSLFLNY